LKKKDNKKQTRKGRRKGREAQEACREIKETGAKSPG